MRETFKDRLLRGEPLLGAQLRFGSSAIAELFGLAGFDFIIIDCEHAPQTPVQVQSQLQAIGCTDATPIVRLGKNDPALIRLYLDMAAAGVAVPFISTAQEAKKGADACRYPPQGTRGFGPSRGAAYGFDFDTDYFDRANREVLFLPIIETAQAVENIDEILSVDGVDLFMIGPADLSISLGVPMDIDHPKVVRAVQKILEASKRAGKPAGTWAYSCDELKKLIRQGFTFLLTGGDEWILHDSCQKVINSFIQAKRSV